MHFYTTNRYHVLTKTIPGQGRSIAPDGDSIKSPTLCQKTK